MLHNEARELLVGGYEATHDAEGIAKAYSVSKWITEAENRQCGLANQPAGPEAGPDSSGSRKYPSVHG